MDTSVVEIISFSLAFKISLVLSVSFSRNIDFDNDFCNSPSFCNRTWTEAHYLKANQQGAPELTRQSWFGTPDHAANKE
jgi:hypothetical protein